MRAPRSTFVLWSFLATLAACSGDPPACPPPPACPTVSAPAREACPAATGFDSAKVTEPSARLALEVLQNLFADKVDPVRAHFTADLAKELPPDKLAEIVHGLVIAHGPPLQIVDAWRTGVREKQEDMPAASVLVRMADDERVNLLIVFDANGAIKGLWLRPI